jgi:hypothetical protein
VVLDVVARNHGLSHLRPGFCDATPIEACNSAGSGNHHSGQGSTRVMLVPFAQRQLGSARIGVRNSRPWSPKVLRAGMWAHILVLRLVEGLNWQLEALGGADFGDQLPSRAFLHQQTPCAWALTSEGQGVSDELMVSSVCACHRAAGRGRPLNVAAAAAVCLMPAHKIVQ